MEERPISIGKNPLIGLTKLVRGETVSAVNVHDCVDTMVRAVQGKLKTLEAGEQADAGQALLKDLTAVRTILTDLLSARLAAVWAPDAESRVPQKKYDDITLADLAPYDIPDLAKKTVAWMEAE